MEGEVERVALTAGQVAYLAEPLLPPKQVSVFIMYRVSKVYLLPDADAVVLLGQVVVVITGAVVEAPHVARDP